MCFTKCLKEKKITVSFGGLKPKIAKKDIKCWKRGCTGDHKRTFYSEYQGKRYKIGELYKTKLGNPELDLDFDYNLKRTPLVITINTRFHINKGFHSWIKQPEIYESYAYVECTIPKGSLYYENRIPDEDGDESLVYVSNQIIINKVIYAKDK